MLTLRPGAVSLADWRAVLEGAPVTLDPACRPAIRASAEAVQAIVGSSTRCSRRNSYCIIFRSNSKFH